jgi:hypothetical protein
VPRIAARSLTRRALLTGAAGVSALGALSSCTSSPSPTPPGPTAEPRPGADETARRAAAATEQSLAVLAAAVGSAYPSHPALLAACRDATGAHTRHAERLLAGLPASSSSSSPSPSGQAVGTPSGAGAAPSGSATATPAVAGTAQGAALSLAQAETDASGQHQAALGAVSAAAARLLASVAASDAGYAARVRPLAVAGAAG